MKITTKKLSQKYFKCDSMFSDNFRVKLVLFESHINLQFTLLYMKIVKRSRYLTVLIFYLERSNFFVKLKKIFVEKQFFRVWKKNLYDERVQKLQISCRESFLYLFFVKLWFENYYRALDMVMAVIERENVWRNAHIEGSCFFRVFIGSFNSRNRYLTR